MKVLIAIVTCPRYLDRRNAARDTWLSYVDRLNPDADITVRFFSGREACLADDCVGDIVHLDCPDTYDELPQKTFKLVDYAASGDFDFLVKVDDDTYLLPLPSHIEALTTDDGMHDCVGSVRVNAYYNGHVSYGQGGCYSLSRRAMSAVLKHPELFTVGLEDGSVGKALKAEGIELTHSERIKTDYRHGIPRADNDIISAHSCPPEKLREIHDQNMLRLLAAYNEVLNRNPQPETPTPAPFTPIAVRPADGDAVTITVTSCGRFDLLRETLTSLGKSAIDVNIKETIILEDSPAPMPDWLLEFRTLGLGEVKWISNVKRQGQWISLDRLMDAVTTEYVFGVEDDWKFDDRPFLAESLEILKQNPKILQVSLRGDDNTSGHPNTWEHKQPELDGTPFRVQQPYWREHWGGFSGNPSLRRKSDWQRIGSYGKHVGYSVGQIAPEQTISRLYLDLGYRIAVLPHGPYVTHLGERRSKAIDPLPAKPKVLIAVPCCWKYAYGQHENELRNGMKRETADRVQAIRDTWLKDFELFKDYVDVRFFYGRHPQNKPPKPQPDEIFLNVPDDYHSLPHKMRAIYDWALKQRANYAFIFKADDDTAINAAALMRCGYEKCDQLGFFRCLCRNVKSCQDYVTGGPGYFLSRRAVQWISQSPVQHWAEDFNTGKILRGRGIRPVGHSGFIPGYDKHFVDVDSLPDNWITAHAVKAEDMRRLHGR